MSNLAKANFVKVNITVDEEIQFAGDKKDSNDSRLKAESITSKVIMFDYYEDVLSPAITAYLRVTDTTNLLSRLPIRGYERVDLEIATGNGSIVFGKTEEKENPLYVVAVLDVTKKESEETFTLALSSLENLMNETTRVQKKYPKANISAHVRDILTDPNILNIPKEKIDERAEIEDCSTPYSFIGNNRKPFYILSWLCPKAQPLKEGKVGGTSGFFFYETYDGFKFKSVDGLLDQVKDVESKKLQTQKNSTREIETYTASSFIESKKDGSTNFQIMSYMMDSTVDLQKNLRVGLYSNLTYFYNPLDWTTRALPHKLREEVEGEGMSVAGGTVPIPAGDVSKLASRVLVRIGDKGMLTPSLTTNNNDEVEGSGRSDADMAKAFSRYTLLFQQSLNITVPCNINLRAGDIIRVEIPVSGPLQSEKQKELDQELSGFYLIRSLRHHFQLSEGKNVTAMNLVRDSFGTQ
tara:strand:- start:124 stop:1521 length:1398 start_codon:yes stop_codon:yes gene_type:complete